ncbi:MAG: hypothetical protein R2690_01745 [Acidimicrobiales bacterium]
MVVLVVAVLAASLASMAGPVPAASATPGVADWKHVFGGSGNNDGVFDVTSDASGNAYVMGTVHNATTWGGKAMTPVGLWDVFVAKLAPNGTVTWVQTFGSNGGDIPHGVAIDGSGNVYALMSFNVAMTIGGGTLASTGIYDIALVKFNSSGTFQWARKLGGATSSDDEEGIDLSVDALGNATVLGQFRGTFSAGGQSITSAPSNQDLFLAQFSSTGNLNWLQRKGVGTAYEYADAMRPYGSGFVITGHVSSGPVSIDGITRNPDGPKGFVAWFGANGTATAVAAFPAAQVDPNDLAVLPTGDAVVVGGFKTSLTTGAGVLTAPAGVERAFAVTATIGGTAVHGFTLGDSSETRALAVDTDEAGNLGINLRTTGTIVLGGVAYPSAGGYDAITTMTSPTGSVLWTAGKVGSNGDDEPRALDIGLDGDLYIGGDMDNDANVFGTNYPIANPQAWVGRIDDPISEVGANRYFPKNPTRVLDSRDGTGTTIGPWTAGQVRLVKVAGTAGVPIGATAVVLNVTGTGPTTATHLTAFPAGQTTPTSSNLNLAAGETAANLVTVKVGTNGNIGLFNNAGSTHVIADIVGWYENNAAGARFNGINPKRLVDTRDGTGGVTGKLAAGTGATRTYTLAGVAGSGVPAGATAVVANVTATGPTTGTHLTAWPANQAMPLASTLNVPAGATRANLAIIGLSSAGQAKFFNNAGETHLIVDVVGYFTTTGTMFTPVVPARILDSRNGLGAQTTPWPAAPTSRTVKVGGLGGVPATASAVALNVTVTGPTAPSHLTIWPTGQAMPTASNLNFVAGQTVPNHVVVKLGSGGSLNVLNNSGNAHVIVDVVGWYS